ncbi:sortase-like acyltransferase [Hyaloraphidium curvatum]|nr:sortase-like acyltransferase [Hyaloraphidium curvatum]
MSFIVRNAKVEDCERMLELVKELATFEKAPEQVVVTLDEFRDSGFGPNPSWFAFVAESKTGAVEGMALCYVRYSTWKGEVLYLEDLVVTEALRGQGAGKLLFEECIAETKRRGYRRMAWQALEWNTPALEFYAKYGSSFDKEWVNCSIDFPKS